MQNSLTLEQRFAAVESDFMQLQKDKQFVETTLKNAQKQMDGILNEQALLQDATEVLGKVKPLLSKASIDKCQELASMAIKAVWDDDYEVQYHSDVSRFYLHKDGIETDIATAEGGGINSVVAFVFQIYLIIKLKKRRVIFLDEQWSGISDEHLERFLEFVRGLCHDLNFDCLLITHDKRITDDQVDLAYEIVDGVSRRLK